MESQGSMPGFILSIIGGILGILGGIQFILSTTIFVYMRTFGAGIPGASGPNFLMILLAFYILIINIFITISCFGMRKDEKLHSSSKKTLIFGILSLNLFAIIGGAIGLNDAKKKGVK